MEPVRIAVSGSGLIARDIVGGKIHGFITSLYPLGYIPPSAFIRSELMPGLMSVSDETQKPEPVRSKPAVKSKSLLPLTISRTKQKERIGPDKTKKRKRKMVNASRVKNRK